MNKLTKIATVVAGAALAIQSAYAGANNQQVIFDVNDNGGGGTTEFDVSLGTLASLVSAAGTHGNVNLNNDVSTFTSFDSSTATSGLYTGAAGGQNGQGTIGHSGVGNDVFMTTTRAGGIGNFQVAGTESAPAALLGLGSSQASAIAAAGGIVAGYTSYGANVSTTGSTGTSFSQQIANTPTSPQAYSTDLSGDNPLQTMTGSTIILDLWSDTVTGTGSTETGWVYVGDLEFTYSPSGSPASLTFDAASPIPEPTTYGVIAGFGLLALSLRRQFTRKNA